ncbi:MAG: DUF4432 family protein [Vulcanimicrobiaceae bacterium]
MGARDAVGSVTLPIAELRRRAIDPASIAGVTPVVYDDARRRGVRALHIRNALGLELSLIVDRGLDASELLYHGVPLTWYGPGNAAPVEGRDPSVDAFERTFFGGLVTTCGMDAYGPPGRDAWGSWPQHGHFNRTAATDVRFVTDWHTVEPAIEIAATILQFQMFGAALRVERTWRVRIDQNIIELRDRVTNDGGGREPHMLLYHCNAGYPLLDERTFWKLDAAETQPRDDVAARGMDKWADGDSPHAGFEEQVFIHKPRANSEGWSNATVCNPTLHGGTALTVSFRPEQLPGLFTWRMLGFGSYVMAVEPANCTNVGGRRAAGDALPFLEPGELREYMLRFEVRPEL